MILVCSDVVFTTSCTIPFKTSFMLSLILPIYLILTQFSFLVVSIMDYNNLATSIRDLTRSLTNWSSTVCIPTAESGKLLDISSAAKGKSSLTPLGATNQPTKYLLHVRSCSISWAGLLGRLETQVV